MCASVDLQAYYDDHLLVYIDVAYKQDFRIWCLVYNVWIWCLEACMHKLITNYIVIGPTMELSISMSAPRDASISGCIKESTCTYLITVMRDIGKTKVHLSNSPKEN